ncbi:MAG: hypothetical protein IJ608_07165 [Lachnospiraceae bacterium]|nr:hypothetical protein [Lachnospiraceae bacterium]
MSEPDMSKLIYEKKPTFCSKCGRPLTFRGRGAYECEHCGFMEYDDFGKIDQYLEKNGPSPAHEISRGTGVPTARVRELLVEGRLEARAGQEGLLDSDLGPKNESIKSHQKGTYMENKHKEQERMRFLDN